MENIIRNDIDVLLSYFDIVYEQKWISSAAVFEIETEYKKLREKIDYKRSCFNNRLEEIKFPSENPVFSSKTSQVNNIRIPENNNDFGFRSIEKDISLGSRKTKIINILKEKKQIQVGEINKILSDVSKRTLRRDFQDLLKQGLVERIGESNDTFYQLKHR